MTDLILSWKPDPEAGGYTWSRWTARRYPNGWRLFHRDQGFVFSAATPKEIEQHLLGRLLAEHERHRKRFSGEAAE